MRPGECGICGANSELRPRGHAWWCWTARPTLCRLCDGMTLRETEHACTRRAAA